MPFKIQKPSKKHWSQWSAGQKTLDSDDSTLEKPLKKHSIPLHHKNDYHSGLFYFNLMKYLSDMFLFYVHKYGTLLSAVLIQAPLWLLPVQTQGETTAHCPLASLYLNLSDLSQMSYIWLTDMYLIYVISDMSLMWFTYQKIFVIFYTCQILWAISKYQEPVASNANSWTIIRKDNEYLNQRM